MATSRKKNARSRKGTGGPQERDIVDAEVVSESSEDDNSANSPETVEAVPEVSETQDAMVTGPADDAPAAESSDGGIEASDAEGAKATATDPESDGNSQEETTPEPESTGNDDAEKDVGATTENDGTSEDKDGSDETADQDVGSKDDPFAAKEEPGSDTGPASAPAAVPSVARSPEPEKKKGGAMGLILGGVIAAVIGFGLARYVVPDGWPVPSPNTVTMQATMAEFESQLAAQSEMISGQAAQIAGQAEQIAIQVVLLEAQMASISDLEQQLAASSEDLGSKLETGLSDLQAQVRTLPRLSDDTVLPADLEALLRAQRIQVEELQTRLEAEAGEIQGKLENMTAFAEGQIASAQQEAEAAARAEARAKARDAMNQVRLALANAEPYAEYLETIAGAVDVPEGLSASAENGVATHAALQSEFGPVARSALSASLKELAGDSPAERLTLFFKDQIGARSLTPQEGSDPDAVLSRAEAAVREGDLGAALDTLNGLPDSGKAELGDWIERAQARGNAVSAFEAISDALSAD